jgi:predicted CxxxxCH...CXXCH cytochrome family protein
MCFKCHSGANVTPFGDDDVAAEFNTQNASFHAIETSTTDSQATSGSFETTTPAWSNSSVLYCASCHGNSDSGEPVGTHSSPSAPMLSSPFWGTTPDAGDLLCYDCHKYTVYYSGTTDDGPSGSGSNFYDIDLGAGDPAKLHYQHVSARGLGCESCHESHGLDREHLIRDGVGYAHATDGGYCANECHSTGTIAPERHDYTRP